MRRSLLPLTLIVLLVPATALSGKKKPAPQPEPAAAPAPAPAEAPKAEVPPVVSYRHNLMEAMGKHMKLTSMIIKGQVDRKDDLKLHAEALFGASASIPSLFPAGTGPDSIETDSLAAVWSDNAGFLQANTAYAEATTAFLAAIEGGDDAAIAAAFGGVGKTCGGCHDTYRVKDEH